MNKEDLDKTLNIFHKLHDTNRVIHYYLPQDCKGYFNHPETDFCITILNDDKVYQVGTEADTIGVELETFEDLRLRYKSFEGEEL